MNNPSTNSDGWQNNTGKFTNGADGIIHANRFVNSAEIVGGGDFYIGGNSSQQGDFGLNPGDDINFWDTDAARFDVESNTTQTGSGVTYLSIDQPVFPTVFASCSQVIKDAFGFSGGNNLPEAQDSTITIVENESVIITTGMLSYTDIDNDELDHITINTIPVEGVLFVDANNDGLLDLGEELADGAVVTKTDLDAGKLIFIGNTDENGSPYATFDFTVNDGTEDAAINNTITINVLEILNSPIAVDDKVTTDEDVSVVIDVLDNDTDVDNDPLSIKEIYKHPSNGTVVINADSTITYIPNAGFNGNDTLEYIVTDGKGGVDTAFVVITVEPKTEKIFIPEGFSPGNNDGVNDYFVILGADDYEDKTLRILNRWGNVVFESDNYQGEWDGTSNSNFTIGGNALPEGTYFYIFEGKLKGEDEVKTFKGYVYLNR